MSNSEVARMLLRSVDGRRHRTIRIHFEGHYILHFVAFPQVYPSLVPSSVLYPLDANVGSLVPTYQNTSCIDTH